MLVNSRKPAIVSVRNDFILPPKRVKFTTMHSTPATLENGQIGSSLRDGERLVMWEGRRPEKESGFMSVSSLADDSVNSKCIEYGAVWGTPGE
jgi:hypothetical protein